MHHWSVRGARCEKLLRDIALLEEAVMCEDDILETRTFYERLLEAGKCLSEGDGQTAAEALTVQIQLVEQARRFEYLEPEPDEAYLRSLNTRYCDLLTDLSYLSPALVGIIQSESAQRLQSEHTEQRDRAALTNHHDIEELLLLKRLNRRLCPKPRKFKPQPV